MPPPVVTKQTTGPDPKECRVILEDMGNVGYRISDAQALATDTLTHLRSRLGRDAVSYEGLLKNQQQLQKMLGKRSEMRIQKEQIKYLEACAQHAPYRVRVRFGAKKKSQFLHLSCRLSTSRDALVEQNLEARSFEDVRARLNEAMPDFCPQLETMPAQASVHVPVKATKGKRAAKKGEKSEKGTKKKSRAELRDEEADFEDAYEQETVLPKQKRASDKWLLPPRR